MLFYIPYVGDRDSAAHKALVQAKPYGDEYPVLESDCTGHVQTYGHVFT